MTMYGVKEMENMFEIARFMQSLQDDGSIKIFDNRVAFNLAFKLAVEFEKAYPDTEDYYCDLAKFITDDILGMFGKEYANKIVENRCGLLS